MRLNNKYLIFLGGIQNVDTNTNTNDIMVIEFQVRFTYKHNDLAMFLFFPAHCIYLDKILGIYHG